MHAGTYSQSQGSSSGRAHLLQRLALLQPLLAVLAHGPQPSEARQQLRELPHLRLPLARHQLPPRLPQQCHLLKEGRLTGAQQGLQGGAVRPGQQQQKLRRVPQVVGVRERELRRDQHLRRQQGGGVGGGHSCCVAGCQREVPYAVLGCTRVGRVYPQHSGMAHGCQHA
jgi:hypothetical protein